MRKAIRLGHYEDVLKGYAPSEDEWNRVQHCLVCKLSKDGRVFNQERGPEYSKRRVAISEEEDEEDEVKYDPSATVECSIHFDLVFVGDFISCFMRIGPHAYVTHSWVKGRNAEDLLSTLL